MFRLIPAMCFPPPNLFSAVADDPSVAVWRVSLACAVLLGAETLLLVWRAQTRLAVALPLAAGLACLVLAIAAWMQSRTFIQVICATDLHITSPTDPIIVRANAAIHTNMVEQDLAVAACALTLGLVLWGIARLTFSLRRPRVG